MSRQLQGHGASTPSGGPRLTTFIPSHSHSTTYRQQVQRRGRLDLRAPRGRSTTQQLVAVLRQGWRECLEWEWEKWDRRLQLFHSLLLLVSLHLSSHPNTLGRLSHLRVFPLLFRRSTRRGFVRRLGGIVHVADAGRKVGVLLGLREKVHEVIEHHSEGASGHRHSPSPTRKDELQARLRRLEKLKEPHEVTSLFPIAEVLLSLAEMVDLAAFLGAGGLGSWRLWRRADPTQRGAFRSAVKSYVAWLATRAEGLQKGAVFLALVALVIQQLALLRIFAHLKSRIAELKAVILEVIDEEADAVVPDDVGDEAEDSDEEIAAQAEASLAKLTKEEDAEGEVHRALESSQRILGAPTQRLSAKEVMRAEQRAAIHSEADALDEEIGSGSGGDEKQPASPILIVKEASPLQRLETALQTTKQRARATYLDLVAARAETVHALAESVIMLRWPSGAAVHADDKSLNAHEEAERKLEWVEGLTGIVAGACGVLKGA